MSEQPFLCPKCNGLVGRLRLAPGQPIVFVPEAIDSHDPVYDDHGKRVGLDLFCPCGHHWSWRPAR